MNMNQRSKHGPCQVYSPATVFSGANLTWQSQYNRQSDSMGHAMTPHSRDTFQGAWVSHPDVLDAPLPHPVAEEVFSPIKYWMYWSSFKQAFDFHGNSTVSLQDCYSPIDFPETEILDICSINEKSGGGEGSPWRKSYSTSPSSTDSPTTYQALGGTDYLTPSFKISTSGANTTATTMSNISRKATTRKKGPQCSRKKIPPIP